MDKPNHVACVKDSCKFEVECRAGKAGGLRVGSESVCVKVGQRVRLDGAEQIWHSVEVYAQQDDNENLVIRVVVLHPDWDEPLQIASISSRPIDGDCQTALACNLEHITP